MQLGCCLIFQIQRNLSLFINISSTPRPHLCVRGIRIVSTQGTTEVKETSHYTLGRDTLLRFQRRVADVMRSCNHLVYETYSITTNCFAKT